MHVRDYCVRWWKAILWHIERKAKVMLNTMNEFIWVCVCVCLTRENTNNSHNNEGKVEDENERNEKKKWVKYRKHTDRWVCVHGIYIHSACCRRKRKRCASVCVLKLNNGTQALRLPKKWKRKSYNSMWPILKPKPSLTISTLAWFVQNARIVMTNTLCVNSNKRIFGWDPQSIYISLFNDSAPNIHT